MWEKNNNPAKNGKKGKNVIVSKFDCQNIFASEILQISTICSGFIS